MRFINFSKYLGLTGAVLFALNRNRGAKAIIIIKKIMLGGYNLYYRIVDPYGKTLDYDLLKHVGSYQEALTTSLDIVSGLSKENKLASFEFGDMEYC